MAGSNHKFVTGHGYEITKVGERIKNNEEDLVLWIRSVLRGCDGDFVDVLIYPINGFSIDTYEFKHTDGSAINACLLNIQEITVESFLQIKTPKYMTRYASMLASSRIAFESSFGIETVTTLSGFSEEEEKEFFVRSYFVEKANEITQPRFEIHELNLIRLSSLEKVKPLLRNVTFRGYAPNNVLTNFCDARVYGIVGGSGLSFGPLPFPSNRIVGPFEGTRHNDVLKSARRVNPTSTPKELEPTVSIAGQTATYAQPVVGPLYDPLNPGGFILQATANPGHVYAAEYITITATDFGVQGTTDNDRQ